jgi:hypothetical protein
VIMFGMNGNARPPVHRVDIGALTLAPMITAVIGIEGTAAARESRPAACTRYLPGDCYWPHPGILASRGRPERG